MKIEILYPEVCNLYGDSFNGKFLRKQLPDANFVMTSLLDKPAFIDAKSEVKLVYLGACSEEHQKLIIEALEPYKDEIKNYINNGNIFIATGNSLEIFGHEIKCENGNTIPCLDIFSFSTTRDLYHRHNSLFLGSFLEMKIMGFKSQFTFSYVDDNKLGKYDFISVDNGVGLSPTSNNEGIKYKNFYGTYLLGPFLVLNPYFMKYILKILNLDDTLIFENAVLDAYQHRLKELTDPKTVFTSKHS